MKVRELAERLEGRWYGEGERDIRGVASLESATPSDLSYAEGERALARAASSAAGCTLVAEGSVLRDQTTITVEHPKLAFVRAARWVIPPAPLPAGIHPSAIIAPQVRLGEGVSVGPYSVIGSGASVGDGTRLGASVVLGEGVRVGAFCVLYPRVALYPGAQIGHRVILHSGVVIGSDGFGYVAAEGRYEKFPQCGSVMIEDDVEIGSNTTIDRGSLGTTVVGEGTKIDNLVQIAHNVRIGRHCVIAAQTGISGSTVIEDHVVIAGQAGLGDHVRVQSGAVIGGQAGILPGKIVRRGTTVWGTPARPLAEFKRMYAKLVRLAGKSSAGL